MTCTWKPVDLFVVREIRAPKTNDLNTFSIVACQLPSASKIGDTISAPTSCKFLSSSSWGDPVLEVSSIIVRSKHTFQAPKFGWSRVDRGAPDEGIRVGWWKGQTKEFEDRGEGGSDNFYLIQSNTTVAADVYLWADEMGKLEKKEWSFSYFEKHRLDDWLELFDGMEMVG